MTYRAGLATRSRILDATRSLLAEGGLELATVKAICSRANVLPGSFYNLFASKEEVVLTIVREAIEAVEPVPDGPEETLHDLVSAFVRFINTEPVIARVYLITAVTGGLTDPVIGRRVLGHHQARVERFGEALRRGTPRLSSARAAARAEALVAALTGYALHAMLDPDFDLAKQAERLLELEGL
ncbi:MAG: TetR/AcrR family transcriptional regulator [Actinomycetota bacterium]